MKKLGRIPDGGRWRAHGRSEKVRGRGIGYDYVHTRSTTTPVSPTPRSTTTKRRYRRRIPRSGGRVLHPPRCQRRACDHRQRLRLPTLERVPHTLAAHAIRKKFIRPHCPWTNGKVERLNRTPATEWAYAQPFTSNSHRAAALPAWLDYYNLDRHHVGIGGIHIDRINNGRSVHPTTRDRAADHPASGKDPDKERGRGHARVGELRYERVRPSGAQLSFRCSCDGCAAAPRKVPVFCASGPARLHAFRNPASAAS